MKLATHVPSLFLAIKIVGQNEQPPNALLEEDVVGTMAEATLSIAKSYDIERECLGGDRGVHPFDAFGQSECFALANGAHVQDYQGLNRASRRAGVQKKLWGGRC